MSKGLKVQRSKGPKFQGSKGSQDQRFKVIKVQRLKGPKENVRSNLVAVESGMPFIGLGNHEFDSISATKNLLRGLPEYVRFPTRSGSVHCLV